MLNGAMRLIDALPSSYRSSFRRLRIFLRLYDMWGLLNAVTEIAYYTNVAIYKTDAFTIGKLCAKWFKVIVQWKLFVYTGNAHYLIDATGEEQARQASLFAL